MQQQQRQVHTNRDFVQLRLLSVDEEGVRLPKFGQKFPVERKLGHARRVEGQPVVVPGLTKVAVHEEGLKHKYGAPTGF